MFELGLMDQGVHSQMLSSAILLKQKYGVDRAKNESLSDDVITTTPQVASCVQIILQSGS